MKMAFHVMVLRSIAFQQHHRVPPRNRKANNATERETKLLLVLYAHFRSDSAELL